MESDNDYTRVSCIDIVVNLDSALRKELCVNKICTSQLGVYPKKSVKIKYNFYSYKRLDQQLKKFALKKLIHAPSRCILRYISMERLHPTWLILILVIVRETVYY